MDLRDKRTSGLLLLAAVMLLAGLFVAFGPCYTQLKARAGYANLRTLCGSFESSQNNFKREFGFYNERPEANIKTPMSSGSMKCYASMADIPESIAVKLSDSEKPFLKKDSYRILCNAESEDSNLNLFMTCDSQGENQPRYIK